MPGKLCSSAFSFAKRLSLYDDRKDHGLALRLRIDIFSQVVPYLVLYGVIIAVICREALAHGILGDLLEAVEQFLRFLDVDKSAGTSTTNEMNKM